MNLRRWCAHRKQLRGKHRHNISCRQPSDQVFRSQPGSQSHSAATTRPAPECDRSAWNSHLTACSKKTGHATIQLLSKKSHESPRTRSITKLRKPKDSLRDTSCPLWLKHFFP